MISVRLKAEYEQAKLPLSTGRIVAFSHEEEACITEQELQGKERYLEVLGECIAPATTAKRMRSTPPKRGCCGKRAAKLTKAMVQDHSDKPKMLIGQVSGQSYGIRSNGDAILVDGADIGTDNRFRTV